MECNECNGTMTVATFDSHHDVWIEEPCWGCVRNERDSMEVMVMEYTVEQELKRLINSSSAESQVRFIMWVSNNPEKREEAYASMMLAKTFTHLLELIG
tara:strand:- start:467 stop:763 length:297 start_codon:yes stop_codon:yes gene_type:complete